MSASWVTMSTETLPVMMFASGWAEPSGVQPIRPPPPEPSDSGLAPDSPSTHEATPAAAAAVYPLSIRYWPIASTLLPLAMSVSTAALPPDEGCVAWAVGVAATDGGVVAGASVDAAWAAGVLAEAEDGATVGFAAFDDRLAGCLADAEATALPAGPAAAVMADAGGADT